MKITAQFASGVLDEILSTNEQCLLAAWLPTDSEWSISQSNSHRGTRFLRPMNDASAEFISAGKFLPPGWIIGLGSMLVNIPKPGRPEPMFGVVDMRMAA